MDQQTVSDRLGISWDEFNERVAQGERFEIVDGEVVPLSPTNLLHAILAKRVCDLLSEHGKAIGEAFIELAFAQESSSTWGKGSRVPDVAFYTFARLKAYFENNPNWKAKPSLLVPDLAVEIVSPTDSYTEVTKKARRYLPDGVRVVWVLDPDEQTVVVHTHDSDKSQHFDAEATLTGTPILADFSIKVSDLFQINLPGA